MNSSDFRTLIVRCIGQTPVGVNLASRRAIVLERVARGGGATHWYYCKDATSLAAVEQKLLPGSMVSFYFDDRFQETTDVSAAVSRAARIIADSRETVVGVVMADGVSSQVEFATSAREVTEFLSDAALPGLIFCGRFPGADNDGKDAVTLTLPDPDGVVRGHPY